VHIQRSLKYAGLFTTLEEVIGKSVRKRIKEDIRKQKGEVSNRSLVERLQERGISIEDLVNTVSELHVDMKGQGRTNFFTSFFTAIIKRCKCCKKQKTYIFRDFIRHSPRSTLKVTPIR